MNIQLLGLLMLCAVLSACSSEDPQALGFDTHAEMVRAHQMGYHTKARWIEMTNFGVAKAAETLARPVSSSNSSM